LSAGDQDILLLFSRDQCGTDLPTPGGIIPRHRGKGDQHLAFSIPKSTVDEWKNRLSVKDIAIESEVDWPLGGHSLYFRDPDNHSVELTTPGIWSTY